MDPDDVTTNLATFFNSVSASFPGAVTWNIPSSGDTIDELTGSLVGAWSGGTAAAITASGGGGAYVAGTGGYVIWQTADIFLGRRLKGRTFLCPVKDDQFDSSGTINNTSRTTWATAAGVLAAVGKLVIWHRPSPGGSNGGTGVVTAATVPDKVTSLRTRRT
jgi:hypothetical protein